MIYLEAIKAGVDIIDTCLAPFALRTSQPAIEPIVATLYGTKRDTGFDLGLLLELGDYLEEIAPKYRDYLARHKMSVIDTGVLAHQVPGGMLSNLVNQLKEAKALYDRIGGPGNSQAVWKILALMLDYLREIEAEWDGSDVEVVTLTSQIYQHTSWPGRQLHGRCPEIPPWQ